MQQTASQVGSRSPPRLNRLPQHRTADRQHAISGAIVASLEQGARDGKVVRRGYYRAPDGRQRITSYARKFEAERFLTTVEHSS